MNDIHQASGEQMSHLFRIPSLSLIVFIISLFITVPVLAIPPLPSSFYGTVKVNSSNVPDGTVIQAIIDGQVYAEGFTQTYQGDSVYALDVRGDDSETAAQDGGREGNAIQFKVGGASADQAAIWHAGTNVSLNLTASSIIISTPKATPTQVPTQTAIVIIQPSALPLTTVQASPTPAIIIQPSQTLAVIIQPSPPPTVITQPSQTVTRPDQPLPVKNTPVQSFPTTITSETSENDGANASGNNIQVIVVIIAFVLAIILGYVFLTLRRKRN
jgi:hypothetical protein